MRCKPHSHEVSERCRDGGSLAALVLCVVLGACGSPPPIPDAAVADAGRDGTVEPPARYCERPLVRRPVGQLPAALFPEARILSPVQYLEVGATNTHEFVSGVFASNVSGSSVHAAFLWSVRRSAGFAELVESWEDDESIPNIAIGANAEQMTAAGRLGRPDARTHVRVRWNGAVQRDSLPTPGDSFGRLARIQTDGDVFVRVVHTPGLPIELERIEWRTDGSVARAPIDPVVAYASASVTSGVAAAGDHVAIALVGDDDVDVGYVLWLDAAATSVEHVTTFSSEPSSWLPGFVSPSPDGSVVIVTETNLPGRRAGLVRARFGEARASDPILLREGFRVFSAAGGADGVFFLTYFDPLLGEPGEGGFDYPMFLAHLPMDADAVVDGDIPLLTGRCRSVGVAGAPTGGAIVVSRCLSDRDIEITYVCVPGVE